VHSNFLFSCKVQASEWSHYPGYIVMPLTHVSMP